MSYFIGIDIAKFKHDCFIQDNNGVVIHKSFSFNNDADGFKSLLDVLDSLDHNQKIKIGLESTGHYGNALKQFLEDHSYSFMEFNPYLIKQFSKATTLRRTKTDKIDAMLISSYLTSVNYMPYDVKLYHIQCLKSLSRLRDALIKDRSLHIVRITNVLDVIFPEFKPFFGNKLDSSTCLYILENYTSPSKIANMNRESYSKMKSKLRHTISYARFTELRNLAKNTVGKQDDILSFELSTLIELYKTYISKIDDVDAKIIECFSEFNSYIDTVPGISAVYAAGIYSEYGDITRFDSPEKALAYAGLEPSTNDSGTHNGEGHMVKHGSSHLRYLLMNAALDVLPHNQIFYDYYTKKRNEGKEHRVALVHVAKKLVRIIYYLEKRQEAFDSNKLR